MQPEHIFILALSGLGVFHGLSLGLFLTFSETVKSNANKLLGIILILFEVRISK